MKLKTSLAMTSFSIGGVEYPVTGGIVEIPDATDGAELKQAMEAHAMTLADDDESPADAADDAALRDKLFAEAVARGLDPHPRLGIVKLQKLLGESPAQPQEATDPAAPQA